MSKMPLPLELESSSSDTERQVWVRHTRPSDPFWQPGAKESEPPVSATMVDLSLGGLRLIVPRRFEVGTLLTVKVGNQTHREPRELLARVLHVADQPDGTWALNCTFARELNQADMLALSLRRVRAAPGDARAWVRFACNVPTLFHRVVASSHDPWPATVVELSPGGMRLRISRAFDPGTLLSVELERPSGSHGPPALVRVRHCASEGDGAWILGCSFAAELSDEDTRALF